MESPNIYKREISRQKSVCAALMCRDIFIFALVLLSTALGWGQQDSWDQLHLRVRELLDRGDIAGAETPAIEAVRVAETIFASDDERLAGSLMQLAYVDHQLRKFSEANSLFDRARKIREHKYGTNHPLTAEITERLGAVAYDQKQYPRARELYEQALSVYDKTLDPDDRRIELTANALGLTYDALGEHLPAQKLFSRALDIADRSGDGKSDNAGHISANLAHIEMELQHYQAAVPFFDRAIQIQEDLHGISSPDLVRLLLASADPYLALRNYKEAVPRLRRVVDLLPRFPGNEDTLAEVQLGLANILFENGTGDDTLSLYKSAAEYFQHHLPEHSRDFIAAQTSLSQLYVAFGRYDEATAALGRAQKVFGESKSLDPLSAALMAMNFGRLLAAKGDYQIASGFYQTAFELAFDKIKPMDVQLLAAINRFWGDTLLELGQYERAEYNYKTSIAELKKSLGSENERNIADLYTALANLYAYQDMSTRARQSYETALQIFQALSLADGMNAAAALSGLASIYEDEGQLPQAEEMASRAFAVFQKNPSAPPREMAHVLNNLADIYSDQAKYGEAERCYIQAIHILKGLRKGDRFQKPQPDLGKSLNNLALMYWRKGDVESASDLFEQAFANLAVQYRYSFETMTEKERLDFLRRNSFRFPEYFSFVQQYGANHPAFISRMFNLVLWQKGMVASSIANLRQQIARSGDNETRSALEEVSASRAEATRLEATGSKDPQVQERAYILEARANEREEFLMARSLPFTHQIEATGADWKKIQRQLKQDEAVVEIVRYNYFDSRQVPVRTDQAYYAALIITPNRSMAPKYVLLGDSSIIEGIPLTRYFKQASATDTTVDTQSAIGADLYQAVFQPLEPFLGKAKRIYFTPDGMLNLVALGTLSTPDKRLLMEKYDLRLINSSRELMPTKNKSSKTPKPRDTAVLIANPDFDEQEAEYRAALASLDVPAGFIESLRKKAEAGDTEAQIELAHHYRDGLGVVKNYSEATVWYRRAADQGDVAAEGNLARMYANGWGVHQDYAQALKLAKKAAEAGDPVGERVLGWIFSNASGALQDYALALSWFRKAAGHGDVISEVNLGRMYLTGTGVAKDEHEALLWFRKAAEKGDADGEDYLGKLYHEGEGVPRDYHLAAEWFRKAAEQGHSGAQARLGGMYLVGEGVEKNASEAIKWFNKSADQGHGPAALILAKMYESGTGVDAGPQQARDWYRKAAADGEPEAQQWIAQHSSPDGTQSNAGENGLAPLKPGDRSGDSADPDKSYRLGDLELQRLEPVRRLEIEVTRNIEPLLAKNEWQVETFFGQRALEEALKTRVHGPRLLHIGTHGYFQPDQAPSTISRSVLGRYENPMVRSGLFLAGANRALAGRSGAPDLEDGILTAFEASMLDLQGTELVVLSACDTGRGVVRDGEGVFGLRRALQEAGAESVLMSLWEVPKDETAEMITTFYRLWLSGIDKHEALKQAQLQMRSEVRQRYKADVPYYWAGFVLVGR